MVRTGTSYFVNFPKACDYFWGQGYDNLTPASLEREVRAMIAEGGIHIGKPPLKPGQRLVLLDGATRYGVEE